MYVQLHMLLTVYSHVHVHVPAGVMGEKCSVSSCLLSPAQCTGCGLDGLAVQVVATAGNRSMYSVQCTNVHVQVCLSGGIETLALPCIS